MDWIPELLPLLGYRCGKRLVRPVPSGLIVSIRLEDRLLCTHLHATKAIVCPSGDHWGPRPVLYLILAHECRFVTQSAVNPYDSKLKEHSEFRVSINASLIPVPSGEPIWSDAYSCPHAKRRGASADSVRPVQVRSLQVQPPAVLMPGSSVDEPVPIGEMVCPISTK